MGPFLRSSAPPSRRTSPRSRPTAPSSCSPRPRCRWRWPTRSARATSASSTTSASATSRPTRACARRSAAGEETHQTNESQREKMPGQELSRSELLGSCSTTRSCCSWSPRGSRACSGTRCSGDRSKAQEQAGGRPRRAPARPRARPRRAPAGRPAPRAPQTVRARPASPPRCGASSAWSRSGPAAPPPRARWWCDRGVATSSPPDARCARAGCDAGTRGSPCTPIRTSARACSGARGRRAARSAASAMGTLGGRVPARWAGASARAAASRGPQ